LNQLPNAEQMKKLSPPTTEMLESYHQYVQINKVEPLMDEKRHRLSGKPVTADAVLRYIFNVTLRAVRRFETTKEQKNLIC